MRRIRIRKIQWEIKPLFNGCLIVKSFVLNCFIFLIFLFRKISGLHPHFFTIHRHFSRLAKTQKTRMFSINYWIRIILLMYKTTVLKTVFKVGDADFCLVPCSWYEVVLGSNWKLFQLYAFDLLDSSCSQNNNYNFNKLCRWWPLSRCLWRRKYKY